MNYTIRKALTEDCPRMMELIRELATFERAPDEVTVTPEQFVEAGFGKNPVWQALVILNDSEKIIGMSLWYMRYSTWKGLRLYLEDLIVTEAYRGEGFGKILFDKTVEAAKNLGVTGMMWQVLDWNEPAIRFYKKYGAAMDNQWITCSLPIESPE
jgi:ribosomal protein S18 acetylase RimI-like enzyme